MNLQKLTIKEIREKLKDVKVDEDLINELMTDSRQGVKKLAQKYIRIRNKNIKMIKKWEKLNKREEYLWDRGYKFVAGIDEAGRGPLAGPVVAAAVVMDPEKKIIGLDDSKKLSEKKREKLYKDIIKKAKSVGVGIVDNTIIDKINILQATFTAMKKAVDNMEIKPDYLLVDGNRKIPGITYQHDTVIDGDSRVNAIAAASIVAKVTRDRIIIKYDADYPQYNFRSNKGYGSSEHIQALKKYGPSPIHRFSFSIVDKNS